MVGGYVKGCCERTLFNIMLSVMEIPPGPLSWRTLWILITLAILTEFKLSNSQWQDEMGTNAAAFYTFYYETLRKYMYWDNCYFP